MANKFELWVENNVENSTQNYSTFLNDSQRQAGFQSGEPASSIRVNSALRQSNLVACALMDVVAPNDQTTNLQSGRVDVANLIRNGIKTVSSKRSLLWSGNVDIGNSTSAYTSICSVDLSSIDPNAVAIEIEFNHSSIKEIMKFPFDSNGYVSQGVFGVEGADLNNAPFFGVDTIIISYEKDTVDNLGKFSGLCTTKSYRPTNAQGQRITLDYYQANVTKIYQIIE